jgi:hypothetical protein
MRFVGPNVRREVDEHLHNIVTRLHRYLGFQGREAAWFQSSHFGGFRAVHESLGRISGQVSCVPPVVNRSAD